MNSSGSLLPEKIENKQLRDAVEHYFPYGNDFSHAGHFSVACQAVGQNFNSMVQPQAHTRLIQTQPMWRYMIRKKAETKLRNKPKTATMGEELGKCTQ